MLDCIGCKCDITDSWIAVYVTCGADDCCKAVTAVTGASTTLVCWIIVGAVMAMVLDVEG